ncbi:putative bifunctional diguanylate cyclase/phosphodiesterase [Lysobacter koreensis]|uniref:Bifunctional diguanylate cyclase/phosphodiesterase n=1 Tax=Lysobacter koreensis TaxID=266122 RepID=A0ABW2YJ90_9GAMM
MSMTEDALTGLCSRRSFLSSLSRHVQHVNDKRASLALLVIDIDGFAQINGAFGYDTGDQMLRYLTQQLRALARPCDYLARIGDNRFAVILHQLMNKGHAELAIQKLFRLLDVPFQAPSARMKVAVSVGVALCPAHASHPDFLLRRAEAALVTARQTGRRHAFAPDAARDQDLSEVWDLEMQLGGAIERGEMAMHYQPQVRLSDLRPVGAEALMRWNSPSRGVVSPAVFIPVAERTGQIKKLTVWALNTALRQASLWPAGDAPLTVSVNLPGTLATQPDLPELVEDALKLWGCDRVQLVLEVTEGSLMDSERAFAALARIRALGAKISIDDFGTGYSCLAYFRNLPADELKVDRSFVSSILTDPASADIAQLIVDLAHRFGLSVAGEGVEDAATLHALTQLGCDTAQGFLLGKAMPLPQFQRWLMGAVRAVQSQAVQ